MANYRARSCPKCNYYVALSVPKPRAKSQEAAVISFCLNCGYKIPVHSVIRGIRQIASPVRRGLLRLANIAPTDGARADNEPSQNQSSEKSMTPPDYARHLRAIGQDLEHLRLTRFNLECIDGIYFVWPRPDSVNAPSHSSILANRRLRKLWQNRIGPRSGGLEEYVTVDSLRSIKRFRYASKRFRYASQEIESIEKAGRGRRCQTAMADGHSLSQLLRTVGGLVSQKNQKLLGIAWQELSVSIVFENDRGRREIDVFRPDHLYDLWVRMYLRRNHRALSDLPH